MAKTRQTIVRDMSQYGTTTSFVWLPYFAKYSQSVSIGGNERLLPARFLSPKYTRYTRLPLEPNQVIAVTRAPLMHLWPPVILWLGTGLGIARVLLERSEEATSKFVWMALLSATLGTLLAYLTYVRWWSNVWYITRFTISRRRKLWDVETVWTLKHPDILKVESRSIQPRWILGWLNIGTVSIQSRSYGEVVLKHVNRHKYIRRAIEFISEGSDVITIREGINQLESQNQQQQEQVNLLIFILECLAANLRTSDFLRALNYDETLVDLLIQLDILSAQDVEAALEPNAESGGTTPLGGAIGRASVRAPWRKPE